METKVIQIETVSAKEFKEEIVSAVIQELKLILLTQDKEQDENEMISRTEAAKKLNISTVKLWELTKNNAITKCRIGRKVLYHKSDIQNYINSCRGK